jgi:hypothetical protein
MSIRRWGCRFAHAHVRLVMSGYIRLVRFSFLILIGRFATLEGMKIKSVRPLH